jgi:hypothetical protein
MGEYEKVFRAAAKFEISPRAAANMRMRYLREKAHDLLKRSPVHPIAGYWANQAMNEILWLLIETDKRERQMTTSRFVRVDRISDDDIEAAKEYPIEQLIDFQRGKAFAWCHEDKNPSMFHATRTNKAICPVCDKFYNPIDVLMERDGMSFKDAVRELR